MIIIKTVDKRSMDIKDIDIVYVIQAPIFIGIGNHPIMPVGVPIIQPDGSCKEYENENIDWIFEDKKDLEKHRKKDEEDRSLHHSM